METKIVTNSYNKNSCKYDKLIKINYLPFIFSGMLFLVLLSQFFSPKNLYMYDLRMSYKSVRGVDKVQRI